MSKLRIGEIYRYPSTIDPHKETIDGYPNLYFYTKNKNDKAVKLDSGINPIGFSGERIPGILTRTSVNKIGSPETPWEDYYNADQGHIRYFGDNKGPKDPIKNGNKLLLNEFEIHSSNSINDRKLATPLIFFRAFKKGYLEFNGYGVITNAERVVQKNNKTNLSFVNYRFDFAILDLSKDNEVFDWNWINSRRNINISTTETEKFAPKSWQAWLKEGNNSIDKFRRNVINLRIHSTDSQKPIKNSREEKTRDEIFEFYSKDRRNKRFEYLAAIVTEHYLKKDNKRYKRGWVTRGASDYGVDFVGRLDIGESFGSTKLVVLGQAKCVSYNSPTNAEHIARTVSRLQRGWIGVFVTTSYFSTDAQREILNDKYPILLINGKELAIQVNEIIDKSSYNSVSEFLKEVDKDYDKSIDKYRDPEEILSD